MNGKNYTASNEGQSNTHSGKGDNKPSGRNEVRHKEKNNRKKEKLDRNTSSDSLYSQKITAEELGNKRAKDKAVELSLKKAKMLAGLKYRDRQINMPDLKLNKSDKGKYSHSNFEPESSTAYSQDEPLDLSLPPSVDPVPIHEPTIHDRENSSLNLFDEAFTDTSPSNRFCKECKEVFEYKYVSSNHSCKHAREKSNDVFKQINRGKINQTDKNPSKFGAGLETEAQESISIQKRIHTKEGFLCDICGKSFVFVNHLLKHKNCCIGSSKHKQYTCEYCDKIFKYKRSLARHSLIHTDEKPHKCDKCGKTFSAKNVLKRHHKGCGNKEKKYACEACPKKYHHKHDLVNHYREHTGEQPYLCEKCGNCFSNPTYFSRHKNICGRSADDRPFACDECNKKFTRKDNLDCHSLIHSGEKPYGCMRCGKKFSMKRYLRQHEKECGCSLQNTE